MTRIICTFCDRPKHDHDLFCADVNRTAFICEACVAECNAIIASTKHAKPELAEEAA